MDAFSLADWLIVALAAAAAGAINALAGGGTLVSFPALTALGLPAVVASITNTVALTPGYLGATWAQLRDLQGQERRLWLFIPAAGLGGIGGGLLLLLSSERLFRGLIPLLIIGAAALLAVQPRLRAWLTARPHDGAPARTYRWATLPIFAAALYGGYFGAGLSVIVLAVLGLALDDDLTRLNALKQALAFAVNVTAALFFLFSGRIVWPVVLVMALFALLGGALGGRLAGRIPPELLRRLVVVIGLGVGLIYLFD